jgi:HD-like signal output (HDOD) protein
VAAVKAARTPTPASARKALDPRDSAAPVGIEPPASVREPPLGPKEGGPDREPQKTDLEAAADCRTQTVHFDEGIPVEAGKTHAVPQQTPDEQPTSEVRCIDDFTSASPAAQRDAERQSDSAAAAKREDAEDDENDEDDEDDDLDLDLDIDIELPQPSVADQRSRLADKASNGSQATAEAAAMPEFPAALPATVLEPALAFGGPVELNTNEIDAQQQADKEALLSELLAEIQRKGDFPTVTKNINEIQRKSDIFGLTSANQLASSIMKDYSLSTKLLRMVNSAYYERLGGRISTLQRAVVMLGFEQVRSTAIGLTVFPKVKDRKKMDELVDSTVSGLMSGVLAKEVARNLDVRRYEEAFACGLFLTLGRQLVLYYLPKRHDRILARMEAQDIDEDTAARQELGVTYNELGRTVAKQWRMADSVISSMNRFAEDAEIPRPQNDEERLRIATTMAHDVCELIIETDEEGREAALEQLLERYGDGVRLSLKKLNKLVDSSVKMVDEQFSDVVDFDIKQSRLLQKLAASLPTEQQDEQLPVAEDQAAATAEAPSLHTLAEATRVGELPDETVSDQPIVEPAAQPRVLSDQRRERLAAEIKRVRTALAERRGLDEVLQMVLDAIYGGLALDRVLLLFYTPERHNLEVRAGRGQHETLLRRSLAVSPHARDPFSRALFGKQDQSFAGANKPRQLPDWCDKTDVVYLYPIEVINKPAAVVYADGPQLSPEELPYLNRLRNYLAAALRDSNRQRSTGRQPRIAKNR